MVLRHLVAAALFSPHTPNHNVFLSLKRRWHDTQHMVTNCCRVSCFCYPPGKWPQASHLFCPQRLSYDHSAHRPSRQRTTRPRCTSSAEKFPSPKHTTTLSSCWHWSYHRIAGDIVPELGCLTALQTLSLRDNHFSGVIPPELGQLTALRHLFMNNNILRGVDMQ